MEVRSFCPLVAWGFIWHWRGTTYAQTVVVKATFRLTPDTCQLANQQDPPVKADVYADGDSRRSLLAASEKVPHKPRADVMLVGHAYAPKKQPVRSLMVRLIVGSLNKSIEVWGDRRFRVQDGQFREGPWFSKMPLNWERAAGGPETINPVGVRFNAEPDAYGLTTIPNLQPPGFHVAQRSDTFAPVCFAPLSATWTSRATKLGRFAGSFSPSTWNTQPFPDGFDYGYFQAAPPDQQVAEIRSNERIILENLHPEHPRLVTSLPGIQPKAIAERASGQREDVKLVADTLTIDTDRGVCVVVWRGTIWLNAADEAGRIMVTTEGEALEELDDSDVLTTTQPTAELEDNLLADAPSSSDQQTVAPWFDDSNGPGSIMPFLAQDKGKGADVPATSENLLADDGATSAKETIAPWFDEANGPAAIMPFLAQEKPRSNPAVKPPEKPQSAPGLPFGAPTGSVAVNLPAPPVITPPVITPPVITPPVVPAPVKAPALPAPPPVITAPPIIEPIAPPADASRWAPSKSDEPRLTFGQTAAQAFGGSTSGEQPVAKQAAPTKKTFKEAIEVLHVEADSVHRWKGPSDWKKLLAEVRPKATPREPDEDIPQELRNLQRNLREVTVIMTRAEALDDQGIRRAFGASVSEDGAFVAPVVLVEGDLRLGFDEVESLKVTAGLAGPLAATNKKVKELLDIADDMLAKPLVFKGSAANLTAKIREQFGVTSVLAQNEANLVIDQTLLERQAYQKRQFFNKKWLRSTLKVGGMSTVMYVPEAALGTMPTCTELRIRAIAELRPKMAADDAGDLGLFVLALARGLGSSSQWGR